MATLESARVRVRVMGEGSGDGLEVEARGRIGVGAGVGLGLACSSTECGSAARYCQLAALVASCADARRQLAHWRRAHRAGRTALRGQVASGQGMWAARGPGPRACYRGGRAAGERALEPVNTCKPTSSPSHASTSSVPRCAADRKAPNDNFATRRPQRDRPRRRISPLQGSSK